MHTQMSLAEFKRLRGVGGKRTSKYKNQRTKHNGKSYDSKGEANLGAVLELMKDQGEIKDFDRPYKIECIPYNCHGEPIESCKVTHKVDFRLHELDGSYTLMEYKGAVTTDYRRRRRWLESFWLPEHLDHTYVVIPHGKVWVGKR